MLYLIRHGEVDGFDGRYCGWSDPPLSGRGLEHARALARALSGSGISRVVSSDLARARMTAEALAEEFGVAVELSESLRECSFGAWEGMSWDAIERRFPEESREYIAKPVAFTFPGGESLESMRRRVMGELLGLISEAGGAPVAVVTHSGPIRAAVAEVMGAPPDAFFGVEVDNCSVSAIELTSLRPVVAAINLDPTRMEVVPWRG